MADDDPFGAPAGGDDDMFGGMEANPEDAAAMEDFLGDGGDDGGEEDPFGGAGGGDDGDDDPFAAADGGGDDMGGGGGMGGMGAPVEDTTSPLAVFKREWRAKIEAADEEARAKKEERITAAKQQLSEFYETRESHKEKKKATNRENEKDLIEKLSNEVGDDANPWERVVGLIDTKEDPDAITDVARFREILIQLKHKPVGQ